MRQVVLDTETTGLEPEQGHRVIEIGGVELVERTLSGKRFHEYLDPGRDIDPGALAVHGITNDFLKDKPTFADIAPELLSFIAGAELVIHNAPFDVAFLDAEMARLDMPGRFEDQCAIVDTLALARRLHPGQRNSLDALCARYGVDNSQRNLHGALLDAEILAEVYLAMTGGQADLAFSESQGASQTGGQRTWRLPVGREPTRIVRADETELAAHRTSLERLDTASGGSCLWLELERNPDSSYTTVADQVLPGSRQEGRGVGDDGQREPEHRK